MIIAALIEGHGGNYRLASLVIKGEKLYWHIDGDLMNSFSDLTNEKKITRAVETIKNTRAIHHVCVLCDRLTQYPNVKTCVSLEPIYLPFEEADIAEGFSQESLD